LRHGLSRIAVALLGLVLAPTLVGSSARAGYLPSGAIYAGLDSLQPDGLHRWGFGGEREPELVAGIPPKLEEDRQDSSLDTFPPAPWGHRGSGTELRPGDGRPAPAEPCVRKGQSSPEVVFYPDRAAPRDPPARPSGSFEVVNLSRLPAERLFRPPRPDAR
jgi:hypothetical protein